MFSAIIFDVCRSSSLVLRTTCIYDLIIAVKAFAEPATLYGRTSCIELVHRVPIFVGHT